MNKLLLSILCALLTYLCIGQVTTSTAINFTDSLGQKQGLWVNYYSNGYAESIIHYNNDKIDDLYYSFYDKGGIKSVIKFNQGVKNGDYKSFHPNGKLKHYFKLNQGKREYFAKYDEQGNIFYEEIYEGTKHVLTRHYTEKGIVEGTPTPK